MLQGNIIAIRIAIRYSNIAIYCDMKLLAIHPAQLHRLHSLQGKAELVNVLTGVSTRTTCISAGGMRYTLAQLDWQFLEENRIVQKVVSNRVARTIFYFWYRYIHEKCAKQLKIRDRSTEFQRHLAHF